MRPVRALLVLVLDPLAVLVGRDRDRAHVRTARALIHNELGELTGVVDGIERDYANAKAVARATAEHDPEMRLH